MRCKVRVLFFFIVVFFVISAELFAQTDIFVRGSGKKYPIALPYLCNTSTSPDGAVKIPNVLNSNLSSSGYFDVLSRSGYIESASQCAGNSDQFAYSDWSVIGAEGLVRGRVSGSGNNLVIQLRLFDVQRQQMVLGKEYQGGVAQLKLIGDKFSNEILKYFTGKAGEFGSQIVYTSRVGRFKELFAIGMDGTNKRQLTYEKGLAISPSWSPSGNSILYTSYQRRVPELFIYSLNANSASPITNTKELEIGGSFSPDGGSLITSVSNGKQSNLVLMRSDGTVIKNLTSRKGVIDVSPSWSPDGDRVVFCSNRAGGPQIYVMSSSGGGAKRISFTKSNYCTSPSWSPAGDRIAFVCRSGGGFQIFTSAPDGSSPLKLTSSGNNEDPEWSPTGAHIAYATRKGRNSPYNIAVIRENGTGFRLLTQSGADEADPSWGPVLG